MHFYCLLSWYYHHKDTSITYNRRVQPLISGKMLFIPLFTPAGESRVWRGVPRVTLLGKWDTLTALICWQTQTYCLWAFAHFWNVLIVFFWYNLFVSWNCKSYDCWIIQCMFAPLVFLHCKTVEPVVASRWQPLTVKGFFVPRWHGNLFSETGFVSALKKAPKYLRLPKY